MSLADTNPQTYHLIGGCGLGVQPMKTILPKLVIASLLIIALTSGSAMAGTGATCEIKDTGKENLTVKVCDSSDELVDKKQQMGVMELGHHNDG